MVLTGAEIIAEVLREQGAELIFGYSDGAISEISDILKTDCRKDLCYVLTARGQSAVSGAEGYARATGKTGVVIASDDVCGNHLMAGVAAAYADSAPVVVMTVNCFAHMIDKTHIAVRKVADLADALRTAFYLASEGRKGPVLVNLHRTILWRLCEFSFGEGYRKELETPLQPELFFRAIREINQAKRPLVLYGGGTEGNAAQLMTFMKKASIPGVHTLLSVSVLPFDEPRNLGLGGEFGTPHAQRAVASSDFIIAVGIRFGDRILRKEWPFASEKQVLYLDTDGPNETNRKTDIFLRGVAGKLLSLLTPFINRPYRRFSHDSKAVGHVLFDIMEELFPAGVYVTDAGCHRALAARYIKHRRPAQFITSGGLSIMGFGYGAAIGAALGLKRRVLHLTGDGSLFMNLTEAVTAVAYRAPVISVIFNNQSFGDVCAHYIRMAEHLGVKSYSCKDAEAFRIALQDAGSYWGPVWIELCIYDGEFDSWRFPG